jgi:hypothetical protein
VGKDCPNTILGGINGIQLVPGLDAYAVAYLIDKKSDVTQNADIRPYWLTVSRSDKYESIDYDICNLSSRRRVSFDIQSLIFGLCLI